MKNTDTLQFETVAKFVAYMGAAVLTVLLLYLGMDALFHLIALMTNPEICEAAGFVRPEAEGWVRPGTGE